MGLPQEIADRADRAFGNLEALTAELAEQRRPSKADAILGEQSDYQHSAKWFFQAVAMARSRDHEEQRAGKAALEEMGSRWGDPQKAVLGDTDAAGGYLVPRNIVAAAIESSTEASAVRQLLTTVSVRTTAAIEVPLEGPSPVRAVIAARGATKANENFTVSNYTATFYTLARIIDVSQQLLRQSGGAAETMTRSRLARAFALGENHYVLSGSGSSEPMGLLTSLAAGSATFTTSHTASDSTVAGSVRAAVSKAIEALAARGREPDGVLLNPGDFAHAMIQGADAAGYYFAPGSSPGAMFGFPGLRVFTSPSIASKTAVVGEWKSAQLFIGQEYRVDTSDEAGDRWDKNLRGFRAELDLAFNGDPYVAAGMFQRITGLIP